MMLSSGIYPGFWTVFCPDFLPEVSGGILAQIRLFDFELPDLLMEKCGLVVVAQVMRRDGDR